MNTIKNISDLTLHYLGERVNLQRLKRCLYKYTDCGAWLEADEESVTVGSIVEGCDHGTRTYRFEFPFKAESFSNAIQAIEEEADAIWKWANVEDLTGKTPAEQGIDFPDVAYDFSHLA